jgi:hypothetical protein
MGEVQTTKSEGEGELEGRVCGKFENTNVDLFLVFESIL